MKNILPIVNLPERESFSVEEDKSLNFDAPRKDDDRTQIKLLAARNTRILGISYVLHLQGTNGNSFTKSILYFDQW